MNKQEHEENIAILKSMIPEYEMKNKMFGVKALKDGISSLEHQLTNGWIPCKERLPDNEREVEVTTEWHWDNKKYRKTCRAFYEDGSMWREDSEYNWEVTSDMKYDEEHDDWKVPQGWYERVTYTEEFADIDDFVIAWRPVTEPYKEMSE